MKKILTLCTLAVLIGAAPAGAADLSRYVALGDSLTAGFASGGLTEYYQVRSYPALLARQAGVSSGFELPLVSAPGIPNLNQLVQLAPDLVIQPIPGPPGDPINAELPRPYNNLGVPGANLFDMLFTTGDIMNLLQGNLDNVMHDLILRNGVNTALEQAIGLDPTFITMWIGNNDILGATLAGTPVEGVTMTPVATFEQLYHNALGALFANTDADIVLINLPDSTLIPFVNSIAPYFDVPGVGRVPVIGSKGPLPESARITLLGSALLAQGIGVPVELGGTGQPLPEDLQIVGGEVVPGFVLREDELATISERTAAYNQIIAREAAAFGIEVLDVNTLFADIAGGDLWVLGGIELSADFLLGGIFSYDGIHPQNIGYALVATELIDLINDRMGGSIPQVNMGNILCGDGGCGEEGPTAAPAGGATFSSAAAASLLQVFPIDLDRMRQRLGPVDEPDGGLDLDPTAPGIERPVRRAPGVRHRSLD